MSKPIVYIHRLGTWYSLYMDAENEERLRSFAEVVSGGSREAPMTPAELVVAMRGASAILSLNGTGVTEITTKVLRQVGTVRLGVVSHWWHGLHDEAKAAWEAAGVRVIEGADANTQAVAEWTVGAMLMGVRRLVEFDRALRAGSPWCGAERRDAGLLCESAVGLIGLGRIG
jgi:phosphoglycerate dehydrogenase-like enzyme